MKRLAGWFIFGLIIVLLWRINSQGWLAVNFVDEQDNFVVAETLLKGEKLYSKIFTHHQPGTYVLSSYVQKAFEPNTIQSLIKQHREVVTVWSIGWIIFLGLRFRYPIMGAIVVLELIKGIYLGNMFLAESLIVAPVIYLGLSFLGNKKTSKIDSFLRGVMLAVVGVSLAPMWPLLGIMGLGWIYGLRKDVKKIGYMMSGVILVLGVVFVNVDIKGYITNAILINQKYYLSIAGGDNLLISFFKALVAPFGYLINGINLAEVWVIKAFIIILLGEMVYLLKKKKYSQVLWIWGLLALANLRNFEYEKLYYDGFHLLIWIGLIINIPLLFLKKEKWAWILIPIILLLSVNSKLLFKSPNYAEDFEIYYSRIFNTGEAIRETKNDDSKLLAMPDVVLGYWQAKIEPAGRFIFFYKWMSGVAELREEQMANFESRPDYLLIKSEEKLNVDNYLDEYQNFSYREEEKSEFYIKKETYKNFDEEKIRKLNYYGFKAI